MNKVLLRTKKAWEASNKENCMTLYRGENNHRDLVGGWLETDTWCDKEAGSKSKLCETHRKNEQSGVHKKSCWKNWPLSEIKTNLNLEWNRTLNNDMKLLLWYYSKNNQTVVLGVSFWQKIVQKIEGGTLFVKINKNHFSFKPSLGRKLIHPVLF